MRFEEAANPADLVATVEEIEQRQKMAAAKGDDTDIFACYAEPPLVAVNLFHLRNGQIVDRREFFWEDQLEFESAGILFGAVEADVSQPAVYPADRFTCRWTFEDREALEELLSEKRGRRVEIHTPQRGQKKAMLELVETNAKHSFDARFRVLKPSIAERSRRHCRTRSACRSRRGGSSASTSRTSRAPIRWRAWWCGKTAE